MTREIKFRAWDKSDEAMKYSDDYEIEYCLGSSIKDIRIRAKKNFK